MDYQPNHSIDAAREIAAVLASAYQHRKAVETEIEVSKRILVKLPPDRQTRVKEQIADLNDLHRLICETIETGNRVFDRAQGREARP